jgi:sugar phosphate isomerase/epimerase
MKSWLKVFSRKTSYTLHVVQHWGAICIVPKVALQKSNYYVEEYTMDLVINDGSVDSLPPRERMRAIKEAGFAGVMIHWTDQFDSDFRSFPDYARDAGLYIDHVHAPHENANAIWRDGLDGEDYCSQIIECIKDCSLNQVPIIVMHPTTTPDGNIPLPNNDIGIKRLMRITEVAEQHNIKIALENMENSEYIGYIFTKIESTNLGFCFDSGHWNIHSPEFDLFVQYGDKLLALYLQDNHGKRNKSSQDDEHAIPLTGNIDWSAIYAKIMKTPYKGAFTLEVLNRKSINPHEFLRIASENAKKVIDNDQEQQ